MREIKGFENYLIDESGTIINNNTSCIKIGTSNNTGKGYLYVDLYKNGKRKRFYIHRLVAKTFIPNPENKPYINHIDGNPKNNNVSNLEWLTSKENTNYGTRTARQRISMLKRLGKYVEVE